MCEVTRDNFETLLPEIYQLIDRAAFISFDCEFTALNPDAESRRSLFDDISQRYAKLSRPAVHSIINQVGLSIFQQDPTNNTFTARTFNLFVSPRSLASVDETFVCSTSSLEFLMRYNFDFNKFLYQGVPYLNDHTENQLRADLRGGLLLESGERNIPLQDEDWIRQICSQLSQWIHTSKVGDEQELDIKQVVPFILHLEIRAKFSRLWTFSVGKKFLVRVVSADQRKVMEEEESEKVLAEEMIQEMIGVAKVIRHLAQSGKPIIGHNCLLDLIKIFHQFCEPLPAKYRDFKTKLHELFPIIFDTKHICFNIRKKMTSHYPNLEVIVSSSNLNDLYSAMVARDEKYNILGSPKIVHGEGFESYASKSVPHEAGFDAYMTGYCFIRLCHLASTIYCRDTNSMRVLRFRELLDVVREYENCINLSRAATNHVNLGGAEPLSSRPPKLVVYSRDSRPLDCLALANRFSRFACSDIHQISKYKAVVAVSSYYGARDILERFRNDERVRVEKYNVIHHSDTVRNILYGGILIGIISGGVLLWKSI